MLKKLEAAEEKYLNIERELASPDAFSNQEKFTALMKEYKNLTPIIEKFREYKKACSDNEEAKALLEESQDAELKELASAELKETKAAMERIFEELKILLLPKDPNDEKNVIVEIRSGAGGEEAALFGYELYRMYVKFAEKNRWKTEEIDNNSTEIGGIKEVVFSIGGKGVYSKMKYESGVHRVQRVPETESQGRVHTSTVTVAVLPEVEDIEITIDEKDLRVDT